mmetsp:Transcript_92979/g.240211  ORF Transcript_92979/g.240211 Transcript_92979/m.240211 type:complete len:723 (-) Transcript_92979:68-2236(-)
MVTVFQAQHISHPGHPGGVPMALLPATVVSKDLLVLAVSSTNGSAPTVATCPVSTQGMRPVVAPAAVATPAAPAAHHSATTAMWQAAAATTTPRLSRSAHSASATELRRPSAVAAVPAPAPAPNTPAGGKAASAVRIAGRTFKRVRELGRGSFGVVWEVREVLPAAAGTDTAAEGPVLALKWSTPARKEMMEACLLEAEVLRLLADALPGSKAASGEERVPRHEAHGVVAPTVPGPMGIAPPNGSHVLLAMSKLEGRPLDQWLYGADEQCLKAISIQQLLEGPMPGGRLATRSLAGAAGLCAALLQQMAPIFGALSDIAYHRDVSAHNFLIREGEDGEQAQFSVLDFGLAVRSRTWSTEWKVRNIAGDPRYFSPAAWMLLAHGHKYVEAHPDPQFRRQYRDRLDHYALGVLVLEVLFALWSGEELIAGASEAAGADASKVKDVAGAADRQALLQARAAWREYWTEVMGLFQRFHRDGAQAIRQALARSEGISQLVSKLRALCAALKAAQGAAANLAPGSSAVLVFQIAAGLVDWRSSWPSWPELETLTERPAASDDMVAEVPVDKEADSVDPAAADSSEVQKAVNANTAQECVEAAREEDKEDSPRTPNTKWRFGHGHRRINTFSEGGSSRKSSREDTKASLAKGSPGDHTANAQAEKCTDICGMKRSAMRTTVVAAQTPPPDQGKAKRFLHRRVWTVDEAIGLLRGVPQKEVGLGAGSGFS